MARGTPQFITGTLPTLIQGGQTIALRQMVDDVLQTYLSNSVIAWEIYDTIDATPGSLHRVYRSVGDRSLVGGAGDARLYIEVDQTLVNRITFAAFQDWSDLSSTGSNQAFTITNSQWSNIENFSECRYFASINEYEVLIFVVQNYRWYVAHFGTPIRNHVPSNYNGVAFTTASASAGSNVTVNLDRDISAVIQDNTSATGPQKVWIYNHTPTGVALRAAAINLSDVTTVTSTSITFASLANSFDSGAIVGFDPCPMFAFAYGPLAFVANLNPTIHFTNAIDGTYTSAAAQIADFELIAGTLTNQTYRPGVQGELYGSRALILADQAAKGGYRGVSELCAFVNSGTLLSGDFWRPNGVIANQYKVFPFIQLQGYTDFVFAIGPGAT